MNLVERSNTYSIKYDALENYYPSKDLTPMWVADMDFETPIPIRNSILEVVNFGTLGYNHIPDNYYSSIVNWIYKIQDYKIEKEWITFIPGVVKGLDYAINFFTNEGDGIILQPPFYPPCVNVPTLK